MNRDDITRKNRRLAVIVTLVGLTMLGLSFAAVPLYKVFCRVTGYGGTTQVSESAPTEDQILERIVNVKFNTDVGRNMVWSFHPDQRETPVRLGQQGIVTFTAINNDRVPVHGVAVYNVSPPKAGKYFHKIQCFCFGEQSLNPGEKAVYPVLFFVDPSMDKDPDMQDVTTITLSYTFFQKDTPELDKAIENFYTSPNPDEKPATDPKSILNDPQAVAGTVALPPEKQ